MIQPASCLKKGSLLLLLLPLASAVSYVVAISPQVALLDSFGFAAWFTVLFVVAPVLATMGLVMAVSEILSAWRTHKRLSWAVTLASLVSLLWTLQLLGSLFIPSYGLSVSAM